MKYPFYRNFEFLDYNTSNSKKQVYDDISADTDVVFAIGDHVGKHFFAVLIDTNKESIHVFDSLSQRTDADIKRLRLSKKVS